MLYDNLPDGRNMDVRSNDSAYTVYLLVRPVDVGEDKQYAPVLRFKVQWGWSGRADFDAMEQEWTESNCGSDSEGALCDGSSYPVWFGAVVGGKDISELPWERESE
jgi:hypothetical protein